MPRITALSILVLLAISCAYPGNERVDATKAMDTAVFPLDQKELNLIHLANKSDSLFIEQLVKDPRFDFVYEKPFIEYLEPSRREEFVNNLVKNYSNDNRPCSPIYLSLESFAYLKTSTVRKEVERVNNTK
jgi:hypothetical protein